MQCFALTAEKRRCANTAVGASNYCAQHAPAQHGTAHAQGNGHNGQSGRFGGIVARMRGALNTPVYDGGKYDVPKWLNDMPTPQVVEQLRTAEDSMVRWMAAYLLRKRRATEAIEPLWQALHEEPIRFVRQQCAVALGKIGTPLVFSPLIEALNHDRDHGVRQACAIALGNMGVVGNLRLPSAMDEIATVLEHEENTFVKWECIIALGQLGDTRVEKLLLRLQAEEIAQVIRDACRDSLAEIRGRSRAMA